MKQILHIFLKDARRFWPEILVSLALVAALVRLYPRQFLAPDFMSVPFWTHVLSDGLMGFLSQALVVLVPLSWWLLISRIIHAERLVGTNQFWLTRPYDWKKLLGAKALFLIAFLYLPIFVAQMLLLAEAGFHPLSYLPGLFNNLLLITGILVLPLVALSALTPTFAKMTLVLLGVILLTAGIALLVSNMATNTTGSVGGSLGDGLSFVVLLSCCLAVIVLQYSLRRTGLSWWLMAAAPILLFALAVFDPDQAMMNRTYPRPASGAAAPVQLRYAPDATHAPAMTNYTREAKELEINVPLLVSGVADGDLAILDAVQVTIDAPDGFHWASPWQVIYNNRLLPSTDKSSVNFIIRREVYDRLKSTPVTFHLAFAVSNAKVESVNQIPLPKQDFFVPEFGVCAPHFSSPPGGQPEIISINCRAALHQPGLTYVSMLWSDAPCPDSQSELSTGVLGAAWAGSLDEDLADFGITSVWETPLNFSNRFGDYRQGMLHMHQICPGSPVTFTRYITTRRTQTDLTLQNFHLPELSIGNRSIMLSK